MRTLSMLVLVSAALLFVSEAYAAPYKGFCYAQKRDGVHCTEIAAAPLPIARFCAGWARVIGATESGSVRNTDIALLQQRQEENCHYVGNKTKHVCFAKKYCGAVTSLDTMGRSVFALDEAVAAPACVDLAGAQYLAALKAASPECSIAAHAVMTLP